MSRNAVGWFELYVKDAARARVFYEGVFGVKLEKLPGPDLEMWAFPMNPDGGGASGALVACPEVEPGGGGTLVYFTCEDCAVQEARAASLGGRIERGKMSIGQYGFISLVVDTEGNLVGLHSMK